MLTPIKTAAVALVVVSDKAVHRRRCVFVIGNLNHGVAGHRRQPLDDATGCGGPRHVQMRRDEGDEVVEDALGNEGPEEARRCASERWCGVA